MMKTKMMTITFKRNFKSRVSVPIYLQTVFLEIRYVQLLYVTSRGRQVDFERRVGNMLVIELH